MTAEIIELDPKATLQGEIHCCACHHRWQGVGPQSVDWFECPKCGLYKARWRHPAVPHKDELIWVCGCECDVFMVTGRHPPTVFCINCGKEQEF